MQSDSTPVRERTPLRVLTSQKLMSPSVGYADQIVGEGSDAVSYGSFSGRLRRTDVDVVHVHRLKAIGSARASNWRKRIAISVAFAAMVRSNGIALVRTWHGSDAAGDGGRADRLSNWILNRVTTAFVVVDPSVATPGRKPRTVVPFGHYRERFIGYPRAAQVPGRILCMGESVPRGAERLIEAFESSSTDGLSLRVAGMASADRTAALEQAAASPQVSTRVERLADGTMVQELCEAELAVVPTVKELDDLHQVFMALTLDRPVLVPDSALTRSVAESVGSEWVHTYTGQPTAEAIDATVAALRQNPPSGSPALDGRDVASTSALYAEVFDAAARSVGRG